MRLAVISEDRLQVALNVFYLRKIAHQFGAYGTIWISNFLTSKVREVKNSLFYEYKLRHIVEENVPTLFMEFSGEFHDITAIYLFIKFTFQDIWFPNFRYTYIASDLYLVNFCVQNLFLLKYKIIQWIKLNEFPVTYTFKLNLNYKETLPPNRCQTNSSARAGVIEPSLVNPRSLRGQKPEHRSTQRARRNTTRV